MELIRCGNWMSYCRTECGKNFLWGSNKYNQCVTYKGSTKVAVNLFHFVWIRISAKAKSDKIVMYIRIRQLIICE